MTDRTARFAELIQKVNSEQLAAVLSYMLYLNWLGDKPIPAGVNETVMRLTQEGTRKDDYSEVIEYISSLYEEGQE